MRSIDPKDAATLVQLVEDDQFAGPGEHGRRTIVVRLLKQLPVQRHEIPFGARVRPLYGSTTVRVYIVFASTYSRYEATRITAEMRRLSGDTHGQSRTVRVSTVRALMHSVRLPVVKETLEYEEAL